MGEVGGRGASRQALRPMPLPVQIKNHHGHGAVEPRPQPPPVARVSMFRRLLVRVSTAERLHAGDGKERSKDERPPEAEVGSVGLDRMVLSFMEDTASVESRPPRGCCNCFNGSGHHDGSDDEEFDFLPSGYYAPSATAKAAAGDALEALKVQTSPDSRAASLPGSVNCSSE